VSRSKGISAWPADWAEIIRILLPRKRILLVDAPLPARPLPKLKGRKFPDGSGRPTREGELKLLATKG
jgi:hypothetical protein